MRMAPSTPDPRVSRTMERLERLALTGRLPGQEGVTRPGLSAIEQDACELVSVWFEEDGLAVSWDSAGNLYGRPAGAETGRPETWVGSHLDTVPNGGRFDGALGVLVALEAAGRLCAGDRVPPFVVVVFRDEEGWRFGQGCFGSRAVCGQVDDADLAVTDSAGVSVGDALARLGFGGRPAGGPLPRRYLEVHIEQGPELDRLDSALGVVTGIAGMVGLTVTFKGAAGHAGTVPMPGRRDAFSACAEFALGLRGQALALPGTVATMGDLRIVDPASNVIPGLVKASVDLRAPTSEVLELLADAAARTAVAAASMHGCEVELVRDWCSDPVSMSVAVQEALLAEAQAAGAAAHTLPSGAGHDAGVMAAAGVETGMLFVRSRNGGVSHRPDELSDAADIGRAIDVLEGAIRRLA